MNPGPQPPPPPPQPPPADYAEGEGRPARAKNGDPTADSLQLSRLTFLGTLQASLVCGVFTTLGLIFLGLGESGRLAHSRSAVVGFRVLAWVVLYQVPLQAVAIMNARGFAMYGIEPAGSRFGWLLQPVFSPKHMRAEARARGLGCTVRAAMCPVVVHSLWMLVYALLTCVPVHPEHGFLGYTWIYGAGHMVVIAIGEGIMPRMLPLRHKQYGAKSGIHSMGFLIMGFFLIVTAFAVSKRYLGSWFGISIAFFLFFYENIGTVAMCSFYTKAFIRDATVREAYLGSPQALLPSMAIAGLTCMSEGARITVLIAAAALDPEDHSIIAALPCTFVLCVLSRTGCIDAMVQALSRTACFSTLLKTKTGVHVVSNGRLLLQRCRFQSGYPRVAVLCSVSVARCALGHAPSPSRAVSYVVFFTLLETVLEDVAVAALQRAGCAFVPEPPPLAAIVPEAAGDKDGREEDDEWIFEQGLRRFQEMPLWCQFSVVMMTNFHALLCIMIFCGGVPAVLGICDGIYTGIGRGIVWWPAEVEGACST